MFYFTVYVLTGTRKGSQQLLTLGLQVMEEMINKISHK